ncbi:hypothetical protein ISF_05602 [Cordyceps fumosorosea ARSEF 2679]|uniref:Uncharacterized protein n=1 Tax=Cordyceps fumosorosea (strain ARSEF 2679) TaxID=1081104 RepID=A0A167UF28_CORFA|nr:hypothetical protein ISF_05602 [Cordyceps fumosorosea ARSEF 2679]OAA61523.1 hypothetical protein ISF_05602 [Cordyceps fumosorosea ARSEF 2679]
MARTLPWKRAAAAQPESLPSLRRASPKIGTPRRTTAAATPASGASATARHRPSVLAAFNSSDPLRSPSTSPPPEPPQERYMAAGDDQYRIVEDELLRTAQRFTTHLHRAEYHRLKIVARSKNDAAIREVERPVVVGTRLTSAARRRRDQAQRLSKQRSLLSAATDRTQDKTTSSSPWVGTNLRGLLNAPRAETRSLVVPQAAPAASSSSSSLTKAAVGHRPPPASTPQRRRPPSHDGVSATTPVSATGGVRARNLATPASSTSAALSSSAPRRVAKMEADTPTPTLPEDGDEDDLDFDDPFGLNKRRLDRKKSRDQFRRSIRATPTKTPSSSSTMPSFV